MVVVLQARYIFLSYTYTGVVCTCCKRAKFARTKHFKWLKLQSSLFSNPFARFASTLQGFLRDQVIAKVPVRKMRLERVFLLFIRKNVACFGSQNTQIRVLDKTSLSLHPHILMINIQKEILALIHVPMGNSKKSLALLAAKSRLI